MFFVCLDIDSLLTDITSYIYRYTLLIIIY